MALMFKGRDRRPRESSHLRCVPEGRGKAPGCNARFYLQYTGFMSRVAAVVAAAVWSSSPSSYRSRSLSLSLRFSLGLGPGLSLSRS